jgi:hypothetical protein
MNQTIFAAAMLATAVILGGAAQAQPAPTRPPQTQPPQTQAPRTQAQPQAPQNQAAPAPAARHFDPITAPSAQEMIRVLIGVQSTPLARLTRCAGKGVNDSDSDVGDFIAGYTSTFIEQGHNWIATVARPAPQPVNGARVWRALVSFHRSHNDEDWAWGMEFLMRADDHSLVPGSITCIGMG